MTRFVFLAASRGQISWGLRLETGEPERRLREEAEGGTQVRQEGVWPVVSEEAHLPKKFTAHWVGGSLQITLALETVCSVLFCGLFHCSMYTWLPRVILKIFNSQEPQGWGKLPCWARC